VSYKKIIEQLENKLTKTQKKDNEILKVEDQNIGIKMFENSVEENTNLY
jgi:hypothetical protein